MGKMLNTKLARLATYSAAVLLSTIAIYSYTQAYFKGNGLSPSDWLAAGIAYTIISALFIYQCTKSENLKLAILLLLSFAGTLFIIGFLTYGTLDAYRNAGKGSDALAAWIQADASIIGLAIAIALPYYQFSKQAKLEKERLRNELAGAIRSIREELCVFHDGLLSEVFEWEKNTGNPQDRFSLPTDPFAMYKGNINNIGKIDDVNLAKRLIRTYGRCADFLHSADLTNKAADVEFSRQDQEAGSILGIQKRKLRESLATLVTEVKTLINDIDGYEKTLRRVN